MNRKYDIKRNAFTLTEVMIVITISSIVLTMVMTIVINLFAVFRDGTVDYKMVEYGYLIRQKVLRTYGLRQSAWSGLSVNTDAQSLTCTVLSSQGEWPSLTNSGSPTTLSFDSNLHALKIRNSLNADADLTMMGIKVNKVEFESVAFDAEDFTAPGKVVAHILFEKTENGKVYMREETFNIIILFI
ncbi:MAG: type II secretion system protein [Lentisphaeria bacterium]|nr:type II secretion system protein [Lentisphaeria bacterium]